MKKIFLIIACAVLFTMCKTKKEAVASAPAAKESNTIQYRDDFRSVTPAKKAAILKSMDATGANFSVLIFTQGYIGEKMVVSNSKKLLFGGYLISNKKTGIADKLRIDNTLDTKIYDSSDKKELIIDAAEAKKHKFIYVKKAQGKEYPFTVTYSNTLRPLE